jgi:DNA-binding transcriptional LysR family regulator
MSDLDDRQLRYFVAVAEELHFGRAAERLGMAQPPLSRAIKNMERQLGVQLLERTTRQVALTAAGAVLLRDARIALDAIAAATERARNAGHRTPSLRVALKADYDAGLLPRILDAYRDSDVGVLPVELILGSHGEQVIALREGRADVAMLPMPFDVSGFDVEPLLTEPRLLALAADDPLAARTSLNLADLDGRTLPDGSSATSPTVAATPRSKPLDLAQIFTLVELGNIVWFPPASLARRHPRPDIAYRTVTDLRPSTLVIAWPQTSHSPAVAAFVRAALKVANEPEITHNGADLGEPIER